MSESIQHVPQYCRQRDKARGDRAYARINGKKFPLGKYGSPESKQRYAELLGQRDEKSTTQPVATIAEAMVRYLEFCKEYYRTAEGRQTSEYGCIAYALQPVRQLAGRIPPQAFGPRLLKLCRQDFIERGYSRKNINKMVGRICRMFRWLAEEEIIDGNIWQSLIAVSGLRAGRSEARETTPIQPVSDDVIAATVKQLPQVVGDMVMLQRLTAMRGGELVQMRPCDIDRNGEVWIYKPKSHKTIHHGRQRTIAIGPRGQEILIRYLVRDSQDFCFKPCDSEAKRLAERAAARKTPINQGNRRGNHLVAKPKTQPGEAYTTSSFRRAIQRACQSAKVPSWSPHQLRHSAATEIRKLFGLEHAQVALGHSKAAITEVYAERDLAKGLEVAAKIG